MAETHQPYRLECAVASMFVARSREQSGISSHVGDQYLYVGMSTCSEIYRCLLSLGIVRYANAFTIVKILYSRVKVWPMSADRLCVNYTVRE